MMMNDINDFVGSWRVDSESSESIEPMLIAMGVETKIRQAVMQMKLLQKIEVRNHEFIVANISKHGEDRNVHMINRGQQRVRTTRGEVFQDDCVWDENNEFPLKITAVLPRNKGITEDSRKMLDGGCRFHQKLTYRHNDSFGDKEPIIMNRFFERVDGASPSPRSRPSGSSSTASRSVAGSTAMESPLSITSRLSDVSESKAAFIDDDTTTDFFDDDDYDKPDTTNFLWLMNIICICWLCLLYFAVDAGLPKSYVALPCLIIFGVFTNCRAAIQFPGKDIQSENMKWMFVWIAVMGCVFVGFVIIDSDVIQSRLLSWMFSLLALVTLALTRVHAGLMCENAKSPFVSLRRITRKQKWGLLSFCLLASTTCIFHFGYDHLSSAVFVYICCILRISMWYEDTIGFGPVEVYSSTQKKRGITDIEGKTLQVKVVGFDVKDSAYAQYKVQVSHEGITWIVLRRYSQFDSLRHELRRLFGHGVLPQLPKKTWFSSLDDEFLEARTVELNDFVEALFAPKLRKHVFKIHETRKFLGVGQGRKNASPEDMLAKPPIRKATPDELRDVCGLIAKCDGIFSKAIKNKTGDGWEFLREYQGCECFTKCEGDLVFTKGMGEISFPPLVVASFLADESTRKLYDDLHKRSTRICEADLAAVSKALGNNVRVDACFIQHAEFKSPFPLVIRARDTILITCRYIEVDGTVTILMISPPSTYAPPDPKYVRASVLCGGIRLVPNRKKPHTCIATIVQMMDPNGSVPTWAIKAVAQERCALPAKIDSAMKSLSVVPEPTAIPPIPQ